jgi:hypothetical protein
VGYPSPTELLGKRAKRGPHRAALWGTPQSCLEKDPSPPALTKYLHTYIFRWMPSSWKSLSLSEVVCVCVCVCLCVCVCQEGGRHHFKRAHRTATTLGPSPTNSLTTYRQDASRHSTARMGLVNRTPTLIHFL